MATIWGPIVYPTSLDGFSPALVDNVDEVIANHPNSLATAVIAIEAKLGITGGVATGFGGISLTGVSSNPGAGGVATIWVDSSGGAGDHPLMYTDNNSNEFNLTSALGGTITLTNGSTITDAINDDIDTGTEGIDTFSDILGLGCVWDYVVRKGANLRQGTIRAAWDSTGDTIIYDETSTSDVGDTSDLTFTVDISSNNVRLRATTLSDDWEVRTVRTLL